MTKERLNELEMAQQGYDVALCHFNWAESDFVDIAISNLNTALDKLNSARAAFDMPAVVM